MKIYIEDHSKNFFKEKGNNRLIIHTNNKERLYYNYIRRSILNRWWVMSSNYKELSCHEIIS